MVADAPAMYVLLEDRLHDHQSLADGRGSEAREVALGRGVSQCRGETTGRKVQHFRSCPARLRARHNETSTAVKRAEAHTQRTQHARKRVQYKLGSAAVVLVLDRGTTRRYSTH